MDKLIGLLIFGIGLYYFTKPSQAAIAEYQYYDSISPLLNQSDYYTDTATSWYNAPDISTNEPELIEFATNGDYIMAANWKVNEYPKYEIFIKNIEQKYNIPTDLLARLIYQESHYRQDIIEGINRSSVGAMGIAQFMPNTAAWLQVNPLDPYAAIDKAGYYLKYLYNKFSENWQYALIAYNWGEGNVKKWLQGSINSKTGQPYTPPTETQNYYAEISADIPIG